MSCCPTQGWAPLVSQNRAPAHAGTSAAIVLQETRDGIHPYSRGLFRIKHSLSLRPTQLFSLSQKSVQ